MTTFMSLFGSPAWPVTAATNTGKHCKLNEHISQSSCPTAESCTGSETKESDRRRSSHQLCPSLKVAAPGRARTEGSAAEGVFLTGCVCVCAKQPKWLSCVKSRDRIRTHLVVARSPEPESGTRCGFRHDTPPTVYLLMKWIMSRFPSGLNYTQRRAAN